VRGRKPSDAETKIAKGETRPSRVNSAEPVVPPPSTLDAPKDLQGNGFRMWRDYAKVMTERGQLRETDMPMFHQHCRTQMDIERWENEKKLKGLDRRDRLAIERILNQLRLRSVREAVELGMTSVARSRVKAVTRPPVDKETKDRFKGGLRGIKGGRA
jgi:phage terminase small subunit